MEITFRCFAALVTDPKGKRKAIDQLQKHRYLLIQTARSVKIPQNSSLGVLTNMASVGKLVQTDFIMSVSTFSALSHPQPCLPLHLCQSALLRHVFGSLEKKEEKKKKPPCGISER